MKKMFVLSMAIFVLMLTACNNEKVYNSVTKDKKTGEDILIGYCNLEGLKGDIFKEAYVHELDTYKVNDSLIYYLGQKLQGISFKVIMGTWCEDTRREVPRFINVLFTAGFDPTIQENFEAICVDSEKKAKGIDLDEYKFEKVPTFIIYREGKEIGRIIETPQTTIEQDLMNILNK